MLPRLLPRPTTFTPPCLGILRSSTSDRSCGVLRGCADELATDSYAAHVADTLAEEMRLHMAEPFPDSVEKGLDYGEVDAVMIGADIYGWATRAGSLTDAERLRLREAADELQRSLDAFPPDAQPYYERLLRIAQLTLAT